ncbi:MAG TPA: tetratricopeptide repeat protein [Pyrinomonadaceae bacterium]|nr:tetratricopeptide repeat protein [Pyrinomonadaceae bacterium]
MRVFAGLSCLVCAALLCGACAKSAPTTASNENGGTNQAATSPTSAGAQSSGGSGGELDTAKLDAEIAGLEQQAEKSPDDDATLTALAEAYVRRGHARHEAHRLTDALHDYQSALKYSPDHEEASLRVAQINREIEAEPHAEDGKPVAVPAKPGANENQ